MIRFVLPLVPIALCATTMTALADCPANPDIAGRVDALLAEAQAAPTEAAARQLSDKMWEQWATAPDAHAQELLDEGMQRRSSYDFAGALIAFSALVDYCPDYAEGYNQRAFAHFLRGEYDAALPDLDAALARNPRHVAALAGKGLTLIAMGRNEEGYDAIRGALDLNPWLSERHYLPDPPKAREIEL